MSTTPQTFGECIADIKIYSKNDGNTELDSWLKNIFNELLAQYTSQDKYVQLFVKDASLSLTASTEAVSLPSDLQHLQPLSIRYLQANSQSNIPQFLANYDRFRQTVTGPPAQWIRKNNTLLITPYSSINTGDTIIIDYYKRPDVLVNDNDVIPVPELIPVLKAAVSARALTFSDIKARQATKEDERQAYIAAQSVT